ncbi:succinate dehydrogenase [Clostridiales bacterium PH28_bin88]|nr:succinate dehydrogenase [Clostridiales bacterium PH28_bin88]
MEPNEILFEQTSKKITFKVQRYSPGKDQAPHLQEYSFPVASGMTILDCLIYIKEKIDPTISFRASCRMGICGSCGMLINGFPRLACQTQSFSLESDVIEIKPLPNYPIIKDLVPDLTPMFLKHKSVKPYIIRKDKEEMENPTREYSQTPRELEDYLQFAYCLKCGICLAACPTVATDRNFFGPQALAQAFRYNSDTRDDAREERTRIVDNAHGMWRCHMAGACAEACPKGVDPAMAVQLLKRQTASAVLGLRKKRQPARVVAAPTAVTPRPGVPKAPEPTIGK